jgi:hypothetical protein
LITSRDDRGVIVHRGISVSKEHGEIAPLVIAGRGMPGFCGVPKTFLPIGPARTCVAGKDSRG